MAHSFPHKQIGVAVIINDEDQVLIDRRPVGGSFGGLWEFPGGKLEPGETAAECIVREVREEIAIEVAVGESLITIDHSYPQVRLTLYVHLCQYLSGQPQTIACEEVRWVAITDLGEYRFPKANGEIIQALRQKFLS